MKISIDVCQLHPSAWKRGVGFYTQNLYQELKKLKDGNQYFLKKNRQKKIEFDLIHYPYFDPFFLTLPLIKRKPVVVTVHDLIPFKFPQYYLAGIRGKVKWQIQKFSLKGVKAIITDSENSKKDIKKITGFPDDKIFVVYLAVEEEYRKLKIGKHVSLNGWDWELKIKEKYHLPDVFMLYVGDLNWNKNIKGLIKAVSAINHSGKIRSKSTIHLVCVGSAFQQEDLLELKELKKLIKKLNLDQQVKLLGFVANKDLAVIYNLAALYIQPSFYEGFGLPVLESMSCGCPVLCSNQASLPEVGGQAVQYFNPYKKNDLEEKLSALILNEEKLIELGVKGLSQAKKFSWQKTALETRKVYQYVNSVD